MSTDSRQSIVDASKWDYHWTNNAGVVYKNMGGSLLAATEVTGISLKSSPAQVQLNRLVGVSFRHLDFFQVWWLLWTSSRKHSLSKSDSHHSLLHIHAWTGRSLVKMVSFRDFLSLCVVSFLSLGAAVQAEIFHLSLEYSAPLQLSLQCGRFYLRGNWYILVLQGSFQYLDCLISKLHQTSSVVVTLITLLCLM